VCRESQCHRALCATPVRLYVVPRVWCHACGATRVVPRVKLYLSCGHATWHVRAPYKTERDVEAQDHQSSTSVWIAKSCSCSPDTGSVISIRSESAANGTATNVSCNRGKLRRHAPVRECGMASGYR
jgi:hypothetical protein